MGRRQDRTRSGATEQSHYADLADIPAFDTDQGGQLQRSYVSAWPTPSAMESTISNLLTSQVDLPNQGQIGQAMAGKAPITPVEGLVRQRQIPGLVEQRANDSTTYPLADAHGDITAVADQTGAVTSRQSYDPWGTQTSGSAQSFGYLGAYMRRSDPDTGLIQMGARQHDPSLGRFTSEDQILGLLPSGQSWNRHSYVINNSLRYMDLNGRSFADDWLKPATNTVGNMARPWKWGELSEDVQQGWKMGPYPAIGRCMSNPLACYQKLRERQPCFTGTLSLAYTLLAGKNITLARQAIQAGRWITAGARGALASSNVGAMSNTLEDWENCTTEASYVF